MVTSPMALSPDSLGPAAQFFLDIAAGDSLALALKKMGSNEQIVRSRSALEHLAKAGWEAVEFIDAFVGGAAEALQPEPDATDPIFTAAPAPVVQRDRAVETQKLPKAARDISPLRRALDSLEDYRAIKHVAPALAEQYGVERIPRPKTRGNALIFLLHKYARSGPVPVDELIDALRAMGVFEDGDAAARQKMSWELTELRKKGWPVRREGDLVSLTRGGLA